jgi:hypothetical protein
VRRDHKDHPNTARQAKQRSNANKNHKMPQHNQRYGRVGARRAKGTRGTEEQTDGWLYAQSVRTVQGEQGRKATGGNKDARRQNTLRIRTPPRHETRLCGVRASHLESTSRADVSLTGMEGEGCMSHLRDLGADRLPEVQANVLIRENDAVQSEIS